MPRRLCLLLCLLILAACRSDPQPETSDAAVTVTGPATEVRPTASSTPVTPRSPIRPTDPPPTASPSPSPQPVPTWPVGIEPQRCGELLPIVSTGPAPTVTQLSGVAIPPGLVPEAAEPALQYLLDSPGTVGLAAYQLGREGAGVFLNADATMPLASVVKIIDLIAYAEAAAEGSLNPGNWIPLSELDRYYLPGTDLNAHSAALADLEDRNLIAFEPPATPLEEIPWLMIRHSSNAASDYLHQAVGQQAVESTALRLGLDSQTAPCPFVGQFLIMANHTRPGDDRQAISDYIADPLAYSQDIMRLVALFSNDDTFRQAEIDWRGRRPGASVQAFFSDNLNAQASAADYAHLMASILRNELSSAYSGILVRRNLEWPMIFPVNQELFSTVGYKNGSLPGVLTTVYYAQRLEDGAQIVVALFFRRLPLSTYQMWRRSLPHDELARWLLADPGAIAALRTLIESGLDEPD